MGLLGLYFQPTGRLTRGRFWFGFLGLLVVEAAFTAWVGMSLGHDFLDPAASPFTKAGFQLSLLINLIFVFPLFVIFTKRCHDRNKSAIWALPFPVIQILAIAAVVVGIVPVDIPKDAAAVSPLAGIISLLWLVVFAWVLIELGMLRGTRGTNRFGADPLAGRAA